MAEDDISYYQARAEQELALAQQATNPRVTQAHATLADHYLELIHNSESAPAKPASPFFR